MKMIDVVLVMMVIRFVMIRVIPAAKFENLKDFRRLIKFGDTIELTEANAGNKKRRNLRTSFFAAPTPTF